jgi:ABC-type spermidine/putrescine transport system permease subunit I
MAVWKSVRARVFRRAGRERSQKSWSRGVALSTRTALLLSLPLLLFLAVFFFGTIISLLMETFSGGAAAGAALYWDVLSSDFLRIVAGRTLRISLSSTVLTLLIGYATAYAMWRSTPRVRIVLIAVIMFPLFTSVVVRTYAWTAMLGRGGLVNTILLYFGVIDEPLRLLKTEGAVLVGMVQVLLPFAILPIFNALTKLDENLIRASSTVGAPPLHTFRRVVLPLTLSGTAAAGVLVFVVSLGFFITPAILGGPQASMISNVIGTEVTTFLNLQYGAAISLILLAVTLSLLAGVSRALNLTAHLKE